MNPDQLAQVLVSKGGYNPADAANAAKGPRAAELAKEFGLGSSNSVTPAQGQTSDIASIARQIASLQSEANKPAIESLNAQIPEIQKGYAQQRTQLEASKAPLQERYQNILDQLKSRETQETSQVQTATAQEFGKRGIPLSSGAYDQALIQKTQPISQYYGGLTKEAGISQEESLQNIADQIAALQTGETSDIRGVLNAIAQLQSTGATNAINQGIGLSQFQQTQDLAKQTANKLDTSVVEVGGRKKLINNQTGQVIQDLGSASSGSSNSLADIIKLLNPAPTTTTTSSGTSGSPRISAPAGQYYQQPDGSLWKSNGASGWEKVA